MDFDQAVGSHSKWKRKLRDALAKRDRSLRPAEVRLDDQCVLGQWIYGQGARNSGLPEFTKLKYEHARFHQVAAELVERANAGESVDAEIEPCSNSGFSTASAAIVIALAALKEKLSG